jgi:hypothetical protein
MKLLIVLFIVVLNISMIVGCTTKSDEAGVTTKKVAEQRLVTYDTIRRLIYKDACGSEGPLSICVERILISGTATVVEAKIKNVSSYSYLNGGVSTAMILLKSDSNEKISCVNDKPLSLKSGETNIKFQMQGHFKGEPIVFVMSDFVSLSPLRSNKNLSILVNLIK